MLREVKGVNFIYTSPSLSKVNGCLEGIIIYIPSFSISIYLQNTVQNFTRYEG